MKVMIFTKEDAPDMRAAHDLGKKLEEEFTVEYLDEEEAATAVLLDLYDIYDFPTFLVTQDDGSEIQRWHGRIPLESDIKMFLQS